MIKRIRLIIDESRLLIALDDIEHKEENLSARLSRREMQITFNYIRARNIARNAPIRRTIISTIAAAVSAHGLFIPESSTMYYRGIRNQQCCLLRKSYYIC